MPYQQVSKVLVGYSLLFLLCLIAPPSGQAQSKDAQETASEPSIIITKVPPSGGGPGRMDMIAGEVRAKDVSRFKLVIFSHTDRVCAALCSGLIYRDRQ